MISGARAVMHAIRLFRTEVTSHAEVFRNYDEKYAAFIFVGGGKEAGVILPAVAAVFRKIARVRASYPLFTRCTRKSTYTAINSAVFESSLHTTCTSVLRNYLKYCRLEQDKEDAFSRELLYDAVRAARFGPIF